MTVPRRLRGDLAGSPQRYTNNPAGRRPRPRFARAVHHHSYESVADIVGSGPLATVVQNLLSLGVYFVVSAVVG